MNALHKKLRLKEGQQIGLVNRPKDFDAVMLPLPAGCKISKSFSKKDDVIFWFVKTQAEMEAGANEVIAALSDDNIIWIGYPKGTSGMQTDLNRDKGWDTIMKMKDITFLSFISFSDIWSTFSLRRTKDIDRKREKKSEDRPIFKYADSATKTITLPDDMAKAFTKNKKAQATFEALSFSNRREYVEWVVTAKREETRAARVEGTMEKLLKGLKNPAGR